MLGPRRSAAKRLGDSFSRPSSGRVLSPGRGGGADGPCGAGGGTAAARRRIATASLVLDPTYTVAPSRLTSAEMAPRSALPSAQPALPLSEVQPAGPGFCASAPPVVRSNTATAALMNDATYTLAPSGLTDADAAPSSAVPSPHAPALALSDTQPGWPGFCASPPPAARSNTATAPLLNDAT
jgi:hypothetical protein